jgi:hypothetical protein
MAQIRLLIDNVDRTDNLLAPPDGEWEIERQAGGAKGGTETLAIWLFTCTYSLAFYTWVMARWVYSTPVRTRSTAGTFLAGMPIP